ncbi:hypothetical protein NF865_01760 [Thermococcus aggregans]|uniref:Uncharacterized protein n=1 Tax=Thermococcus aggregans TaxID=110163 RepID=A0A9E7MY90_THEAG|nr:hypothetical protein [Thermococcus aggregans]USS40971.1 hypothetical protein NF865_01760 [Thermococcus aggregans]
MCGSVNCKPGEVIITEKGAKHIIKAHILVDSHPLKSKFEQLTAKQLLKLIKDSIENGEVNCAESRTDLKRIAIEKYQPKLGVKLRVVIQCIGKSRWKVITAFPVTKG